MGYPEKKAEPRKRAERMQKCSWIENQGIQIPMEPNFRLRSTTVHLILHILHWSFSWRITVKVLGTVNAHDLPISCQETRLRRQTVLWDSDWRLLEQFLRILSSHLCLVLFFLVTLSHEPPRCSAEPWRWCVFEPRSDWTLMVTSQPTEVLNVQGWEAALSPTYPTFRRWGGGIRVNTRYCFSSFEFGTPQTFVKGIPVRPSCWIPLPWTLSGVWEGCHRETVDVQHGGMEERKMRPLALPVGVSEPSEQQSLQGSYLGPSFRETCLCR